MKKNQYILISGGGGILHLHSGLINSDTTLADIFMSNSKLTNDYLANETIDSIYVLRHLADQSAYIIPINDDQEKELSLLFEIYPGTVSDQDVIDKIFKDFVIDKTLVEDNISWDCAILDLQLDQLRYEIMNISELQSFADQIIEYSEADEEPNDEPNDNFIDALRIINFCGYRFIPIVDEEIEKLEELVQESDGFSNRLPASETSSFLEMLKNNEKELFN